MPEFVKIPLRQIPMLTKTELESVRQPEDIVRIVRAAPEREYVSVRTTPKTKFDFGIVLRLAWLVGSVSFTSFALADVIVFRDLAALLLFLVGLVLSCFTASIAYGFHSSQTKE